MTETKMNDATKRWWGKKEEENDPFYFEETPSNASVIPQEFKYDKIDFKDSFKSYKPCDHPPKKIFHGSGWSIWSGRISDIRDRIGDFDLILNCSNMELAKFHHVPVRSLLQYFVHRPKEIVFNWPDMSAPKNLSAEFWKGLFRHISRDGLKVLVFCVGGHGRTGTALACLDLGMRFGAQSAKEAIEDVRKLHCQKAVETSSQREYIEKVAHDLGKRGTSVAAS